MRTLVILLIAMVIPVMGMSSYEEQELGKRAYAEEKAAKQQAIEDKRYAKTHPGYQPPIRSTRMIEPNSIPASVFAKPKPESEFVSMVKLLLAVGMGSFFLPLVALGVLILGPCMIFIWVHERRKKPKSTITKDTYYKTLIDTLEDNP
jgi:hypothetical protein